MQTFHRNAALLFFTLLLSAKGLFAQSTGNADAILGIFQDNNHGTKVGVYKENNQYFGKITELGNRGGKARVGTILLKNLTYANGKWSGKVYAPSRDSDYPVVITLPDPTTMSIRVNAGIITRNLTWKRVRQ
jgi:uncharacterized protein (DUF2147 family)